MKIKSEKGFTGIDIAVSVIVLVIFVSIIAGLLYKFASKAKEVYCKSEAVRLAIKSIEEVKEKEFDEVVNEDNYEEIKVIVTEENAKEEENSENKTNEIEKAVFYRKYLIEDDIEDEENNEPVVKKVTVSIKYMVRGMEKEVKLSTIIVKKKESKQ